MRRGVPAAGPLVIAEAGAAAIGDARPPRADAVSPLPEVGRSKRTPRWTPSAAIDPSRDKSAYARAGDEVHLRGVDETVRAVPSTHPLRNHGRPTKPSTVPSATGRAAAVSAGCSTYRVRVGNAN